MTIVNTTKIKAQEEKREEDLMRERDETPELRAADLKQELSGTMEQREAETRTILLTMHHGEKPNVVFTGFWNGHLVRNAENAISRAYRQLKHKLIRVGATITGG